MLIIAKEIEYSLQHHFRFPATFMGLVAQMAAPIYVVVNRLYLIEHWLWPYLTGGLVTRFKIPSIEVTIAPWAYSRESVYI